MSIGLNDLKPRARTKTTARKTNSSAKATGAESAPLDREPMPKRIRPWSDSGLAKTGQSRKQQLVDGHYMNDEWSSLQESPIFWMNINESPVFSCLHGRLLAIEKHCLDVYEFSKNSLQNLKRIFLSRT